jgi:molybdenum cofactor synthesis domain-containing protein
MRVALVTVGDELLAGDTVNTNAAWLGEQLTARGVTVGRATAVPDDVGEIARVVNESRAEFDAVIVTGGLGPTHDDVTMAGVAAAFGREVEPCEAAVEWLEEEGGYARDDLAEGTAELPAGVEPLHNTVGVAPGCVIDSVYVLPGVPAEMESMFRRIADEFVGPATHVEEVAVDEPESALLDRFEALQDRFRVSIGSYPGEVVRVKIQSENPDEVDDAATWLRQHSEVAAGEAGETE